MSQTSIKNLKDLNSTNKNKNININILNFKELSKYIEKDEIEQLKNEININKIKHILQKENKKRTLLEKRLLIKFLINKFDFFKKKKHLMNELFITSGVLQLEKFSANQEIIKCGEYENKLYLILDGTVQVIRPTFNQEKMTVKNFLDYISTYNTYDQRIKYKRILDKNKFFNFYFYNQLKENDIKLQKIFNFYIEDEVILKEISNGFSFGETSLNEHNISDTTIRSVGNTQCISLSKFDYQNVMADMEQKMLLFKAKKFKETYKFFYNWGNQQIIKLFYGFNNKRYLRGEYIYKQNDNSDYIYLIKSGVFELYSLISFGWYNKFLDYILNSKNNLMKICMKYKEMSYEKSIEEIFEDFKKNSYPSPCKFKENNIFNEGVQMHKKENYLDILKSQNNLKDDYKLNKILITKIDKKEIIGLEDSLEYKQRFCFVKCVSDEGEVEQISLFNFFKVMNMNLNESFQTMFLKLLTDKKIFFYEQLKKGVEYKQNYFTNKINDKLKLKINDNFSKTERNFNIQNNNKNSNFIIERINNKSLENKQNNFYNKMKNKIIKRKLNTNQINIKKLNDFLNDDKQKIYKVTSIFSNYNNFFNNLTMDNKNKNISNNSSLSKNLINKTQKFKLKKSTILNINNEQSLSNSIIKNIMSEKSLQNSNYNYKKNLRKNFFENEKYNFDSVFNNNKVNKNEDKRKIIKKEKTLFNFLNKNNIIKSKNLFIDKNYLTIYNEKININKNKNDSDKYNSFYKNNLNNNVFNISN